MGLKGIIFDLDGTLVNSVHLIYSAYKFALFQCMGRQYVNDEISSFFGPNEIGVFKKIAPNNWEECVDAYFRYEREHIMEVTLVDDILNLLRFLRTGAIETAIVTGRSDRHVSLIMRQVGINDFFSLIITGSETDRNKKSAINKVLKLWNYENDEVIYLGDTTSDMMTALETGIRPAWALWTPDSKDNTKDNHLKVQKFFSVKAFQDQVAKEI